MKLYVVSAYGRIGLRAASTLNAARKSAIADVGLDNFESIRPATEEDVAWVRGMGGHVPKGSTVDAFEKQP
jgi:hypothetical protein